MQTQNNLEKGQVMIIFVMALVILLGFSALAIDGGMVYSDRRYDQSVADAAALAGASAAAEIMSSNTAYYYDNFNCASVTPLSNAAILAARQRALTDNFTIFAQDLDHTNHGVKVLCGQTTSGGFVDKYMDVWVKITSQTNTAFAHLFYSGPIRNTVEAIVRVRPRADLAYGYAIAAISNLCGTNTGGVDFNGNNDITVNGGGIFSNSCITKNGTATVRVNPSTLGVNFITTYTNNGASGGVVPNPAQVGNPLPRRDVPVPNCAAATYRGNGRASNPQPLQPGRYDSIRVSNNETVTLAPGLYCMYGDVDLQGGNFSAAGVTFIILAGNFNTNGQVNVNIASATTEPNLEDGNVNNDWIRGMLIYMPSPHNGQVNLQGGSSTAFTGTVYAPDGVIKVGGSSAINPTYNTQCIGKKVTIDGGTNININFNGAENYQIPNFLDMQK